MTCECTCIGKMGADECMKMLEGVEFAEIRMDEMELGVGDVERIFSMSRKLIATCRPGKMGEEERKELLSRAIRAGASHVDIEVEGADGFRKEIIGVAKEHGCRVIVSYHNYEETPGAEELRGIVKSCFDSGADIAKIACMARSAADNARLLGLLDSEKRLIVIGMGKVGRITRVIAPLLGSEITFVSCGMGKETAPGQMGREELEKIMEVLGNV